MQPGLSHLASSAIRCGRPPPPALCSPDRTRLLFSAVSAPAIRIQAKQIRLQQAVRGTLMAKLNINGRVRVVQVEPDTPLLWVIREHVGLTGTKYGCGIA